MIGDMMMRLFNQQPYKVDPSELTGVVIIDEIDIHLHPKLQKIMVEQLTRTFPKVQFIASTHSPIPLLGAPVNSCFYKVKRRQEVGVEIVDLTELGVQKLLPNAMLSSDLFDMNNLFDRSDAELMQGIRSEDTYSKVLLNNFIDNRLAFVAQQLSTDQKKKDEKNK
jgi:hypothetical protein